MNGKVTDEPSQLDRWLEQARRTLRDMEAPEPENDDEDSTLVRKRANDPAQRLPQRDFLAKQLTELARRSDPHHRRITAELLPADWTTFADFEFALRMWDAKQVR